MFYVVPDTLLKVLLSTNKTDHHVLRYTWHIVESVIKNLIDPKLYMQQEPH